MRPESWNGLRDTLDMSLDIASGEFISLQACRPSRWLTRAARFGLSVPRGSTEKGLYIHFTRSLQVSDFSNGRPMSDSSLKRSLLIPTSTWMTG
jgi:hypothetical protein